MKIKAVDRWQVRAEAEVSAIREEPRVGPRGDRRVGLYDRRYGEADMAEVDLAVGRLGAEMVAEVVAAKEELHRAMEETEVLTMMTW